MHTIRWTEETPGPNAANLDSRFVLSSFEWANDPPIGCREWLIPSALIKKSARIELLSIDAWDALLDAV